jgi:hypothetical protein
MLLNDLEMSIILKEALKTVLSLRIDHCIFNASNMEVFVKSSTGITKVCSSKIVREGMESSTRCDRLCHSSRLRSLHRLGDSLQSTPRCFDNATR